MLSTFPVLDESVFANDPFPHSHLEPGWETFEPVLFSPQTSQEPTSGSDTSNPIEGSTLDDPDKVTNSNPVPIEPDRAKPKRAMDPNVLDERKRRRMISNRDSARRSRMRKQRHLENLRNLLNRLRASNRDLSDRVRVLSHHDHVVRRENSCLRSEAAVLRQRLWDIRQVLVVRQLQQHLIGNNNYAFACNNSVNYHDNNNNNNNNNNNGVYSTNHNVMSAASFINNDGVYLNHHSLTT